MKNISATEIEKKNGEKHLSCKKRKRCFYLDDVSSDIERFEEGRYALNLFPKVNESREKTKSFVNKIDYN